MSLGHQIVRHLVGGQYSHDGDRVAKPGPDVEPPGVHRSADVESAHQGGEKQTDVKQQLLFSGDRTANWESGETPYCRLRRLRPVGVLNKALVRQSELGSKHMSHRVGDNGVVYF